MLTHTSIDETLRRAAEANDVAGVVALATTADQLIYEGAFGKRNISEETPMSLDTVFWIASMTKAITATAAMQLVENGALQLDAPIGDVVPALAAPQVLEGFDATGQPKLRPARRAITLRHLLTHTAGFGYDMWSQDLVRYGEVAGVPNIICCEHRALTAPLLFDPGEGWEYGTNIDWVGKAVEAASGVTLDVYFSDRIFAPLGMRDTAFLITPVMRSRLASMHARLPDGSLTVIPFEVPQQPEFLMGGGGLYGTGPDYIKFLQMLLQRGTLGGKQILKPETVDLMMQNHIGELTVHDLKSAMPQATNDVALLPGTTKKWGLSFMINVEPLEHARSAASLAWAGMANTYFWLDPTAKLGGVILTQTLPFADPIVLNLFEEFERSVYAGH